MAGEVVPLKVSADAKAESDLKARLLKWRDELAEQVLKAVREDAALMFLDNVDDEEEAGAFDLKGDYDPIVDQKTGARLSDAIAEFAEEIKRPEKELRRLYKNTLKAKWKIQKHTIPTDPTGKSYGKNYLVNKHGVWTRLGLGGPDLYVWRRIARTRIDHDALSRDTTAQRNWRHHYLITDETGEFQVSVGNEKLSRDAGPAISFLIKHGIHVVESKEARQHLAIFLRYKPRTRIIRAPRTGWFEVRKGNWVFVLPDETLGDTKITVILDNATHKRHGGCGFHRSGSSEEWRERIAKPLAGNSNVLLAVGTFLAAPLLRWSDEPGGGFHIHGPAKVGKTLVGADGQSVYGKPYAPGAGADAFGYTWESTANRIGERAVQRSDVGLSLDEIGIGDQRAIATTVYKLAGGLDKGRWGQVEQDFNILFLSTGELSLAEFLPNARPGQLIRMVDVPAVVQPESAFETISKGEIAAAGRQHYSATREYHGTVGHDWLQHLVALGPRQIKIELKRLREAWWALPQVAEIASRANPQVVSVIGRFALVAAALSMASVAGVVPWSVLEIETGIIACMSRWLQQRGSVDTAGGLLREIRRRWQMFAATVSDRFIHIHINVKGRRLVPASIADQRKMDMADRFDGYIKGDYVLVTPEAWHRWWVGLDADAVKKHLRETGLLRADPSDPLSLQKFKSKTPPARFYVLAKGVIERA
jgi:putative DNA primase/helicase